MKHLFISNTACTLFNFPVNFLIPMIEFFELITLIQVDFHSSKI